MSGNSTPPSDREERLDEAVAAYLEAVENGQQPDRAEWLARFPDLADELSAFLDDQERVHGWMSPLSFSSDGLAAGGDPLATLPTPRGFSEGGACRLANYDVLSEIARGGMGIVYRARQLNPSRVVALKMILAGAHASPGEIYRFQMETEAAASLDHPNIMPIYEVGNQDGQPFFSMKLMEGGTLAEHLTRFAGEGQAAARLLIKVARAVHHAHQRGILHRDLKPANILLDTQGEPYVTDFGLCRRVEGDSGMTRSGMIVGTPSYMSPEQAAGRKDLTTSTDVYSLGAILYTLLTDRPPFRGNTPLETVRGVLEQEPSRPRLLRPHVDRDLETICLKCLDKRPVGRYGSAEALADDLQRWLSGEPIVARRSSLWERAWKRTRRNPATAALVALSGLAVVFLITAGVVYQNHRITAAEAELAKANRVSRLRSEASDHVREANALLRSGDAQNAKLHSNLAHEQTKNEPELQDLESQAQHLLALAERQIAQQQARAAAIASRARFHARRDDALFYGSQFASELPANLEAAYAAGAAALSEIGLTPSGEGSLNLHPALADNERRALSDAGYELLLVLADIAARQESPDSARAVRFKKRAEELRPTLAATTAQDHFLLGYDARRQGDTPVAISEFRQALRLESTHTWARYFLAACCLPTTPREAEGHLTTLLDERPDLHSALLLRGIAHANLGESKAADEDFSLALARTPASQPTADFLYTTLAIRGNLRALHGNFAAAVEDLLEAIRLKPEAHVARLHLAHAYEQMGRTNEAAQQLEKALAAKDLTPPVESGILLYRAHLPNRESDAALADVKHSLVLHPYAEAWIHLAAEPLRHKPITVEDHLKVVECCDNALATPSYSPETYSVSRTHYLRAHALVELARHQDAAASLNRFLSSGGQPTSEIRRLLGLIAVKRGEYPVAIHELSESLAIDSDNAATLAERGSVYLAIGATGLAAGDFEAAIAKNFEIANAHAGRGLIRAANGDAAGAEQDAEQAWRCGPPTQRLAWMAARTFAITHGQLEGRGRFLSVEEGKSKLRYRQRALELLEAALTLTPPAEHAGFWQDAVLADAWLRLLNDQPQFRELAQKYAPPSAAAPQH